MENECNEQRYSLPAQVEHPHHAQLSDTMHPIHSNTRQQLVYDQLSEPPTIQRTLNTKRHHSYLVKRDFAEAPTCFGLKMSIVFSNFIITFGCAIGIILIYKTNRLNRHLHPFNHQCSDFNRYCLDCFNPFF
jgi:hypothetical protein